MITENNKTEIIKKACLEQNQKFKIWAVKKSWSTFHSSHYDWWAFPIDKSSNCHGSAYKVGKKEHEELIESIEFIAAVQENAILVCQSWGWDLEKGCPMKDCKTEQKWQRWPVRLSKMCRSLELFHLNKLFVNALKYGILLLKEHKKFTYAGKDLTPYFYEKWEKREQFTETENMGKIIISEKKGGDFNKESLG